MDRSWTNARLLETSKNRIRIQVSEHAANQLQTCSEYYHKTRTKLLGHILRLPPEDAMYHCVLTPE
eukprot:3441234-Amphidinium_carterae.1